MANPGMRVTIKGIRELASKLGEGEMLDQGLRSGFEKAAIIVQSAARENVHQVTGKLYDATNYAVEGHGFGTEARIGTIEAGFSDPRHYDISQTTRWKTPRSGTNTGDPYEYGQYEEYGTSRHEAHPFLEPALEDNTGHIEDVIERAIAEALR